MRRFSTFLVPSFVLIALFAIFSNGVAFAAIKPVHQAVPTSLQNKVLAHNSAATCSSAPSESNCTGQDPVAQGCSGDAYTVNGGVAHIYDSTGSNIISESDLRYSNRCQSNWARTIWYNDTVGNVLISATVTRQTDWRSYSSSIDSHFSNTDYTDMVYAPTASVQACGTIDFTQYSGGSVDGSCTPPI